MWMVFILSVCCSFTLVMSLAFCLCWRKNKSQSELTYVDGLVIKKNPDENVNHLTSSDNIDGINVQNGLDNKRATLASNTRRSLPDIPDQEVEWKPSGDNNSEYYASVEQYQGSVNDNGIPPNENQPRCSISQHSSLSQADFSPYERVKYDKIKAQEHPYAQLQPPTSRTSTLENKDQNSEPGPSQIRPESLSESGRNSSIIPAATAVAGGISANAELPYITSPVPQQNFSGDSQDSKGYTSISVREPLSKIVAETKEKAKKHENDPHYSTVSDDSDDVYTTIPDQNQIYTSESETYAKITQSGGPAAPILVEVEINHNGGESSSSSNSNNNDSYEPPPEISKIPAHSRQASSSSSIINVGSPKPEKRQANSPLPPPPVNNETNDEARKSIKNLDELYAKVQKNKSRNNSIENEKLPKNSEHNYETLRKINDDSDANYEKIRDGAETEPGYTSISGNSTGSSSDPGYEVLEKKIPHPEKLNNDLLLGYSLINKKKKMNYLDHNYESVETEPNYESVDDPNYESIKRKIEPGYESIDKSDDCSTSNSAKSKDEIENPYEKLSSDDTDSIGYAKIKEKKSIESSVESDNSNILDDNVIFEV